jgi:hypothetical protein
MNYLILSGIKNGYMKVTICHECKQVMKE